MTTPLSVSTGKFAEETTESDEWFSLSWQSRKLIIQDFASTVLQNLEAGWLDEEIHAQWVMNESSLGMAYISPDGGRSALLLSEILVVCSEIKVKEVVVHELSHLVCKSNEHNADWKNVCKAISVKYPELHNSKYSPTHHFTEDEVGRITVWKESLLKYAFRGVCSNGHTFYRKTSPSSVTLCVTCEGVGIPLGSAIVKWSSRLDHANLSDEYVADASKYGQKVQAMAIG